MVMRDDIIIALPGVIFILFLLTAQADPVDNVWYDSNRHNWVFETVGRIACPFQTGMTDIEVIILNASSHCIDVKLYPTYQETTGRKEIMVLRGR